MLPASGMGRSEVETCLVNLYIYINTDAGCNVASSAQYFEIRARIRLESGKHYVFITLKLTSKQTVSGFPSSVLKCNEQLQCINK